VPGFVIAVFLALFTSAAAQALTSVNQASPTAQKPLPAIQRQKDTLVVGSEQDYPPFATGMTDATAGGFTVDLWKAVAAETGLKYTIRVLPFHQLLQEFKEGKIDVLLNLAQSDERHQFADFTVLHVMVHGAIFVRKGESNIRSEDDFAGKSIIVLNADLAHDYAGSKGWEKQLVLVDTSAEGLRLLASGKHDAMLLSTLAGMQTLQALGLTNIEALQVKAGFSQKFAFAVEKGQTELLARLNEGLALTKSNGTYNALYEKWFGIYEVKEAGLRDVLKYIIPIVVLFLVIGAYFFYRRQVERKRIEETLRAQSEEIAHKNVELERVGQLKSDFLANMSHELRTPLNSIIGFSEMLKDGVLGDLDAKQRGSVADIFDAGTHLLSLINDILDLSKVEAGMLQIEPAAVDVPALLKASTLVVREKALAHRIRLDIQLDSALGCMLADERKLKQIVYNLLSNAVKFTAEGGAVTLRARRCTRTEVALDDAMPARLIALPPGEDGEFLAISVEDTGVGIAEEHLPKLFAPFMQVESSIARRQAGTGLGLSLVRRLAELHGGTVGVASRPEAGSRFCVWLPYREAAPAMHEGGPAPEDTAPSAPAVPLALVIEDDDRIADLIAAQLRAEGFEVIRAATGEEGLVRAAKSRPQLITLDIFLPAMDGWEFMRRLKANPKLADVPVVIITVSEDLDRGLALGARRVLQKPFMRAELMEALAGLVDARSGGERARVLVVDDNVKAVELMATALEAEGYLVMRAYGGAEAIEVARSARPDLVVLDLMMPEVSGFEVARALRESEHTARIPILVFTAKDLTAEDHARLNGNVSAILARSIFSRSELLAELRRALPKRAEN